MKLSRLAFVLSLLLLNSCSKKTVDGIDFTIKDLEGKTVSLSQYRGKTVLLNIWATWCAPCKREIPDLKQIYADQKDHDVVVLGVLLASESAEKSKPFVQQLGIDYPVWYGDDTFEQMFNINAFPTTIIIDKNGKAVKSGVGA